MESVFTDYVDAFREGGRTVLLSSHILAEVERLCDRVSIIRAGRRVETGTLAELRHLTRTSVVAELAAPPVGLDALDGRPRPGPRGHPGPLPGGRHPAGPGARRARAGGGPVAHHPAADARGAVPAPLRRPRGAAVTGVLVRRFLRRDRWMLVWWGLGCALLYYSQAVSVKGLYATQAEFDRAARDHAVQHRVHRHGRPGPRPQHHRRPGDLAGHRVRRRGRRADEHVPGRPPHPGRGGERPRRAAARRRRRAARPDDGRRRGRAAGQRPARPPGGAQPDLLPPRGGRTPSPSGSGSPSPAGCSPAWRCSPRSSRRAPARCTA